MPTAARIASRIDSIAANPRREPGIAFILAFVFALACGAADPPLDIAKRVAERETQNELERANYTYRQFVLVEEVDDRGARTGEYRETRDILFTPEGHRIEQISGKPLNTLKRLKMTEEDFRDIREIQPMLLTREQLWAYETKPRGEEEMDGVDCWVLEIRPRQLLDGQRLFEGSFWVDKRDFSIVRAEGRAVPQIRAKTMGKENLFPHFTTLRERVNGFWFPIHTYADDFLDFSTGPKRIRFVIRYRDYKRFSAESKIIPQ